MSKIGLLPLNNNSRLPRIGIVRLGRRDASGKTTEVDHFLFDVQDETIRSRIAEIYGPKPKALNVTFHTNDLETVYTCEYQYWGTTQKRRKPYLMCSGNGVTAIEFGKQQKRPCSCAKLGKGCRKKTILRFLLPKVTMGGTFLLVTKSQYSTEIIETTLKIAQRRGNLIMRPFKLLRTEGFATVNSFKVKKWFLALMLDETADVDRVNYPPVEKKDEDCSPPKIRETAMSTISSIIPAGLVLWDDARLIAYKEKARQEEGREKVRRKLNLIIKDPGAETALKAYACERFKRESYEELTVQELLMLWHDIGERRDIIADIYDRLPTMTSDSELTTTQRS